MPSPTGSWQGMLDAITTVVGELRSRRPEVETVGIGAAGMVDLDGMIHYAPNVLGFRRTPVQADVAAAVGLPTVVDNDANVAAYAELRFGAARGMTDAIVITLGTGIGGGVLVGGQVLRGAHGFAAEVGHFQIDPHGPMCACGERGHWEAMASGNALGRDGAGGGDARRPAERAARRRRRRRHDPRPARLGRGARRRARRARARRRGTRSTSRSGSWAWPTSSTRR